MTLRRPPPLETPLTAVDGEVRDPAAAGRAGTPGVEPFTRRGAAGGPGAAAVGRRRAYPGLVDHPSPAATSAARSAPDGLRIFPGRLPDGRTAAPFRRAGAGRPPATVWAALDCPGGWAVIAPGRPYVLGRIAAVVAALPAPGDECVVTGAMVGGEGRKAVVHTSLYAPGRRPARPRPGHLDRVCRPGLTSTSAREDERCRRPRGSA